MEAANQVGGTNILHICGFEGASNDVTIFKDYPAQVVNWATRHEDVSLTQGQELFPGKAVLGGFENGKKKVCFIKVPRRNCKMKQGGYWLKLVVKAFFWELTVLFQMTLT